ncbi:type IV pilus biogenesis protein pilQ [Vibrio ishigakensis]|uniref:Type IV pilus biogenesis protein pilQ n=1 Tax=Vibrio ishigakensis TaxID=1481914 RepID=A0A0B8NNE4_9VIBR|nr:type IV pilus biogenesis protein pilQ [Vibrio ishigakensis]
MRSSLLLIILMSRIVWAEQEWFMEPYVPEPKKVVVIVEPELRTSELESKLFSIKYASASDIAVILGHHRSQGVISDVGSLSVDERTNSLLIYEYADRFDEIESIISSLDIPVKQVLIEARIVTLNQGNADEIGVRWGLTKTGNPVSVAPTIEALQGSTEITDNLNVNLGLADPNAGRIALRLATLGSDTLLDLELSALQAETKAEIISSPRLVTTNKKPAYIEQGSEIPYLEAASSGATSVSFRKAVLSLEVIPQITPDNRLVLDLSVTQDRPGQVVKTGIGEAVAIDTQRIRTQVLVDDGETLVLGGIFQKSLIKSVEQVPYLADIPWLGHLFKRTSEKLTRSELLIFVTPKIQSSLSK